MSESRCEIAMQARKTVVDCVFDVIEKMEDFVATKTSISGKLDSVLVLHRQLYSHPPMGYISRCRMLFTVNGEYTVHVVLRLMEQGNISSSIEIDVQQLCTKYSPFSNTYKFCPGISLSDYNSFKEVVPFDPKGARVKTEPITRIDSTACKVWYSLGTGPIRKERKEAESLLCFNCVRLNCYLNHQMKRTMAESPSKRMMRQSSSSHARLKYMSPGSQVARQHNVKMERSAASRKLKKYEETEVSLDSEQDEEMDMIQKVIEDNCSKELEAVISEGEKHGVGSRMRDVWTNDKRATYDEFMNDQSRNSKLI